MLQPGHRFEKPLFEDYFHPGQLDDEEPIFLPPEPAVNAAASNERSSDGYSDTTKVDFVSEHGHVMFFNVMVLQQILQTSRYPLRHQHL